jgi:phage terminase small subunit
MKGHRDLKTGLTAAEERFCIELVKPGTSQADAYRHAFPRAQKWADKTMWEKASRLAADGKVRARVQDLRDQVTAAGIIDAVEVKLLLSRVARADIRKCYREDGTLKSPREIDDETAAGILGFETIEEARGTGKDRKHVAIARKLRFINRVEALDKLMRHYGLYEKDNRQLNNPWKEILDLVDGKYRGLPINEPGLTLRKGKPNAKVL